MRFPPGQAHVVKGIPTQELQEAHRRKPHLAYLGHVPYSLIRNFAKPPHLFTVLRDPVDRVLSHYYFLRQCLVEPGHGHQVNTIPQEVRDLEIGEFLRQEPDRSRVILGELQTRMLTDHRTTWQLTDYDPACPPPALTREDLELAKKRLRQCVVVGLAHRVMESLQLLCDAFGWPQPDEIGYENRTSARPDQQQVGPDTRKILHEITAFDRELFEEGVHLFEQKWGNRRRYQPRLGAVPASFANTFDQGIPGHGWFPPEPTQAGWFSWTGQSAWLEFYLRPSCPFAVTVEVLYALDPALYDQLEIRINGYPLDPWLTTEREPQLIRYRGVVTSAILFAPPAVNRITFGLPRALRPCDVAPGNPDTRSLGVAISRVDVRPDETAVETHRLWRQDHGHGRLAPNGRGTTSPTTRRAP